MSGRGAAALEPLDELVEPQLLEALADGFELGRAELDQPAAFLAELEGLPQAGLARVEPPDDRLDPRAGRLVGERRFRHRPWQATAGRGRDRVRPGRPAPRGPMGPMVPRRPQGPRRPRRPRGPG